MNKISILMPIFNEQKFIEDAIKSVITQSYSNFELLIVDDFSTDNSCKIIKKYLLIDDRIKLIQNIKKGKNAAFNLGFQKSAGDLICFFAGDDVMEVDSLKNRLSSIENISCEFKASTSKVKTISEISKFNNVIIPKNKNKGTFVGGAIMFNRELAEKIFPIPIELPNEDRWTGLHMKFFAEVAHSSSISLLYRIHNNNSSSRINVFEDKNIDMHKRFIVFKMFLEKYRKVLSDSNRCFLNTMIMAEELRFNGQSLKILFIKNISFKNKIRFLFHSNKLLYSIRIIFFKFFSGWGES